MEDEVHGLGRFYASGAGAATARLVRQRLRAMWPSAKGLAMLGIGHSTPYLDPWRGECGRCIALSLAQLGLARFPQRGPASALVAEEDTLPFPDLSFDRVLLIHGLEMAENSRRLLREVWRVLKEDGRVLVVVTNRRGLWARTEHTPFGHGQPYSPGQVTRLLERQMFRVQRRDSALFCPPFTPFLRAGKSWEGVGRALCPSRYAGVALVEARKDVLAAAPAGEARVRRRILLPV